ncbi:hypothetical protein QFZ20_002201 [Flavobacterium sp. W4I14]|nr:hypothetical protein [Flavobacterium sp. W4I14]
MKAIKLDGDESEILSIKLNDILSLLDLKSNVKWGLLWIEAVGTFSLDESMLDFEDRINNSDKVFCFELDYLFELSDNLDQIINIIIVGDEDMSNMKRYKSSEGMYANCEYVLELIDSSYWIIHSKDEIFLRKIKNEYS